MRLRLLGVLQGEVEDNAIQKRSNELMNYGERSTLGGVH